MTPPALLPYLKGLFSREHALAWLIALVVGNQILWFTPGLSLGYYAFMLLMAMYLLAQGEIAMKPSYWLLVSICAFSILFNDIPDYFHPWLRLITFIIATALVSPLFHSPKMRATRLALFEALMFFFSAVTILSMILRPIGFVKYQGRFFCGLAAHSMELGAIASLSLLYCTFLFFRFPLQKLWQKLAMCAAIGLCAMAGMSSGSRAAFLGGLFALCVFIAILFFRNTAKTRRIIIGLIVLAALSYPLWRQHLAIITYKNHGEITDLDLSSRQHHWENLLEIFQENPSFGKGFSYIEDDRQFREFASTMRAGQIETGNSWLTVLAMTGAFGGICIATILFQIAASLLRILRQDRLKGAYLISVFAFFLLHMCAEGYIFAAGGMMFFSFWLFTGTIHAVDASLPRFSFQPLPDTWRQASLPTSVSTSP